MSVEKEVEEIIHVYLSKRVFSPKENARDLSKYLAQWHRKIVKELEEKHEKEMQALRNS